MVARADRIKKTVTFTQSAADRGLLKAVEIFLAEGEYASFGELCKHALREFVSAPESNESAPDLLQFAQQLMELQRQFFDFKETITEREVRRFEQVESQITDLRDQLQQLETKLNQSTISESEETITVPVAEADPLLDRLGALLEDF